MFSSFQFSALRRQDGQATIELALAIPLLLLLVTGMCNFGMAFRNYSTLTDATNVAARQLAISRGQTTDPCSTASKAVIQAAPSLSSNSMSFTTDIYNGTSHWQYTGTSCSGPNTYSGPPGNLFFQGVAKVTVSYPCTLWRYGTAGSCAMTASTAEAIQ